MASLADIFELRFQGIAVRFDQTWSLGAHIPHGAFLDHHPTGLTLHLRGWHRHGDAEWLRKELYAQNWKGPPVNVELRTVDGRNIIGGTFAFIESGKLVREWFISDGRSGANASVLFPEGTFLDSLEPYERLLDSVILL